MVRKLALGPVNEVIILVHAVLTMLSVFQLHSCNTNTVTLNVILVLTRSLSITRGLVLLPGLVVFCVNKTTFSGDSLQNTDGQCYKNSAV